MNKNNRKHSTVSYFNISRILIFVLIVTFLFTGTVLFAEDTAFSAKFIAIPLGTKGGLIESDLSSYLLAPAGSTNFIALDAGTITSGLQRAVQNKSFDDIAVPEDNQLSVEGYILQNHIKAYAISHAHLDHVAGLVINSPSDSSKPILGLPNTIDNIRDHLFNWKIWPNFGDDGEGYQLKKYNYVRLSPGEKQQVENTAMFVTAYELSHSNGYLSTAFLVESAGEYMLYFGDTGPDAVEKSNNMQKVWEVVAPHVKASKLHGIFLEVSFPSEKSDDKLYGHLTPKWLMQELHTLAKLVNQDNPNTALQGLKVVVTHIKPTFNHSETPEKTIMKELSEINDLGVQFIFPKSGTRIVF